MRAVLTLFGGTVAAQIIPLALLPVLTRQYSPEMYGTYAVYFSLTTFCSILGTLRYAYAIMAEPEDRGSLSVVALCTFTASVIAPILGVIVAIMGFNGWIIKDPLLGVWVALGIWLNALLMTYSNWQNRNKAYKRMALSRIYRALGIAVLPVIVGFYYASSGILILGFLLGQSLAVISLLPSRAEFATGFKEGLDGLRDRAKKHINFPRFSLFAGLLNNGSNQFPLLTLKTLFGEAIAGFYSLTERALSAPIGLLSVAVRDVFRERAASEYHESGQCLQLYLKTSLGLAALAAIPCLIIGLFGEELFAFVFGEEWAQSGRYAQWLAPLFFLRFCVGPVSYLVHIAGLQARDLKWQICLFIGIMCVLIYSAYANNDSVLIIGMSSIYSLWYVIYYFMNKRIARGDFAPKPESTN